MNLHVISTGSKGNCYLLTDDQGRAIALDAGVAVKEIYTALNHDIARFDGALITHEHKDHCKAAKALADAGIPVYMTIGTVEALFDGGRYVTAGANLPFKVGSWYVRPFVTDHDAAEPVGFLLANGSHRIMYATDTYLIRYSVPGLTHIIVECNYVSAKAMRSEMDGRRDRLMKSHMSLETLLRWLKMVDLTHCVKIILVHLSDSNSDEKQMVDEITNATGIETIAAADGMNINMDLFPF